MFKVGDIVRIEHQGDSIVGIVYENGNKKFGDFRVETVWVQKFRFLQEADLTPATPIELGEYAAKALDKFTPEAVIAKETAEAGGTLPEQITENLSEESGEKIKEED